MVRYRSFLLISCSTLDHVNEQRSPLREILPLIDRSTGVKVRSIRDEKISVYKIIHVRKLYPLWIGKLQVDALIFSFKVQLHLSLTSVNRKYMYHLVYIILELGRGDFPLDFSGWTRPKCTVWTDWPIGALERTGKWIARKEPLKPLELSTPYLPNERDRSDEQILFVWKWASEVYRTITPSNSGCIGRPHKDRSVAMTLEIGGDKLLEGLLYPLIIYLIPSDYFTRINIFGCSPTHKFIFWIRLCVSGGQKGENSAYCGLEMREQGNDIDSRYFVS